MGRELKWVGSITDISLEEYSIIFPGKKIRSFKKLLTEITILKFTNFKDNNDLSTLRRLQSQDNYHRTPI